MKLNIKILVAIISIALPANLIFAQSLTPDISNAKATICSYIDKNLRYGDTDLDTAGAVTELQNYLFTFGYYPHSGNGEYGWATFNAVSKFQKDKNLPSTGFFGPLSRESVKQSSCSAPEPIVENNPIIIVAPPVIEVPVVLKDKYLDLPYAESSSYGGWKSTWGLATTTEQGFLELSANASTTGAEALLVGSENWVDYSYTINFNVNRNGSFSLLGRVVDDNNFIACTFSADAVSIQQRLNGVTTVLASARTKILQDGSVYVSTQVNMKVIGNRVSCSGTGNEDVVATIKDGNFSKGGIGLSIWHSVPDISHLELREVSVVAI